MVEKYTHRVDDLRARAMVVLCPICGHLGETRANQMVNQQARIRLGTWCRNVRTEGKQQLQLASYVKTVPEPQAQPRKIAEMSSVPNRNARNIESPLGAPPESDPGEEQYSSLTKSVEFRAPAAILSGEWIAQPSDPMLDYKIYVEHVPVWVETTTTTSYPTQVARIVRNTTLPELNVASINIDPSGGSWDIDVFVNGRRIKTRLNPRLAHTAESLEWTSIEGPLFWGIESKLVSHGFQLYDAYGRQCAQMDSGYQLTKVMRFSPSLSQKVVDEMMAMMIALIIQQKRYADWLRLQD